ncbi:MAG TPA: nitroreductase family protein, partial [Treponema sp.]|nr:nitroreductase family protein [Treponema sp.]
MNITLESIESRRSVRSFTGRPLSGDQREALETALEQSGPCPFGSVPRFRIVESEYNTGIGSGRIGTYGIIRNAPCFIVGAVKTTLYGFVDFGYALEGIALLAVGAGLGTCWLGGTFDRSGVAGSM